MADSVTVLFSIRTTSDFKIVKESSIDDRATEIIALVSAREICFKIVMAVEANVCTF
jgi:hypothetical protein